MNDFLFLVPISIAMGIVGLLAFLWSLRSDQYDDMDGAAYRMLEDDDTPIINTTDVNQKELISTKKQI